VRAAGYGRGGRWRELEAARGVLVRVERAAQRLDEVRRGEDFGERDLGERRQARIQRLELAQLVGTDRRAGVDQWRSARCQAACQL
jgi:hypothetical protein